MPTCTNKFGGSFESPFPSPYRGFRIEPEGDGLVRLFVWLPYDFADSGEFASFPMSLEVFFTVLQQYWENPIQAYSSHFFHTSWKGSDLTLGAPWYYSSSRPPENDPLTTGYTERKASKPSLNISLSDLGF